MARTFRLRHLPHGPGFARKYIDGSGRQLYRRIDKELEKQIEEEFGKRKSWSEWTFRYQLKEAILRDRVSPLDNKREHRWTNRCAGIHKAWRRKIGNRKIRRPLQLLMKRWALLGDD